MVNADDIAKTTRFYVQMDEPALTISPVWDRGYINGFDEPMINPGFSIKDDVTSHIITFQYHPRAGVLRAKHAAYPLDEVLGELDMLNGTPARLDRDVQYRLDQLPEPQPNGLHEMHDEGILHGQGYDMSHVHMYPTLGNRIGMVVATFQQRPLDMAMVTEDIAQIVQAAYHTYSQPLHLKVQELKRQQPT